MKLILIALSLVITSAASANAFLGCTGLQGAPETVIALDIASGTAFVRNTSTGSMDPYVRSTSSFAMYYAPTDNLIAFEGQYLVDTGKVIVFNKSDSSVKLITYDLLKLTDSTLGPVTCTRNQ